MPFASKVVQFSKKGPSLDFIPAEVVNSPFWYVDHAYISQQWNWESKLLTDINTQIVIFVGYDDAQLSLLYRVDNAQYNGANPLLTNPALNGFTYVAANDGFYVNPGQWVTFTCDYTAFNNTLAVVDITISDPADFSTEATWNYAIDASIFNY